MNVGRYFYTVYIFFIAVLTLFGMAFASGSCDESSFWSGWANIQNSFYGTVEPFENSPNGLGMQVFNQLYYSMIGNITNKTEQIAYVVYMQNADGTKSYQNIILPGSTVNLQIPTNTFNYFKDPLYTTGAYWLRTNQYGPSGQLLLEAYYVPAGSTFNLANAVPLRDVATGQQGNFTYGVAMSQQQAQDLYERIGGDIQIQLNMQRSTDKPDQVVIAQSAGWQLKHMISISDTLRNVRIDGHILYGMQYGYQMPVSTQINFLISEVTYGKRNFVVPSISQLAVVAQPMQYTGNKPTPIVFFDDNPAYYPPSYLNTLGDVGVSSGQAAQFLQNGCQQVLTRVIPIAQQYSNGSLLDNGVSVAFNAGFSASNLKSALDGLSSSKFTSAEQQGIKTLFSVVGNQSYDIKWPITS